MKNKVIIILMSAFLACGFFLNSINAQDETAVERKVTRQATSEIVLENDDKSIIFKADEKKYYYGDFEMSDYVNGTVDLNDYSSGEYDDNTKLTININVTVYTENGQVTLKSISENTTNNILLVYEGSNLKINTTNDYGIKVTNLESGKYDGIKKTILDVNATKIGILAEESITIHGTELNSKGSLSGISNSDDLVLDENDYSTFAMVPNMVYRSEVNSSATSSEAIAVVYGTIVLSESDLKANASNGKGAIYSNNINSQNSTGSNENFDLRSFIDAYSKSGTVIDSNTISLTNTCIKVRTDEANIGIKAFNFFNNTSIINDEDIYLYLDIELNKGIGLLGYNSEYTGSSTYLNGIDISIKVKEGIGIFSDQQNINTANSHIVHSERKIDINVEKGYGVVGNYISISKYSEGLDYLETNIVVNGKSQYAYDLIKDYIGSDTPACAAILAREYVGYQQYSEKDTKVTISAPDIADSYGIYMSGINSQILFNVAQESSKADINIKGNVAIKTAIITISLNKDSKVNITGEETGLIVMQGFYAYEMIPDNEVSNQPKIIITGKKNSGILHPEVNDTPNTDYFGMNVHQTNMKVVGGDYAINSKAGSGHLYFYNSIVDLSTTKADAKAALFIERIDENSGLSIDLSENCIFNIKSLGQAIYSKDVNWYVRGEQETPSIVNTTAPHQVVEILGEEGLTLNGYSTFNVTSTNDRPDVITKSAYYADNTLIIEDAVLNEIYPTRTKNPINETPSFPYAKDMNISEYENYQWQAAPLTRATVNLNITNNGITTSDLVGNIKLDANRTGENANEKITIEGSGSHHVSLVSYSSKTALFDVKFNANGGKFSDGNTIKIISDVATRTKVEKITPKLPTRKGYVFEYWYLTNPNVPFDMSTTITDNLTLTAKWRKANSTAKIVLTYSGNNQTSGKVPASQKVTVNEMVIIADKNTLKKTGYVFGGWNTKSDGTGKAYVPGSKVKLTRSMILYATWIKVPKGGMEHLTIVSLLTGFGLISAITYYRRKYKS